MSTDFEALLVTRLAPRLRTAGYEYDERLAIGAELYAFRKTLGEEVHAVIQFQHRQDIALHDFTVNLITAKSREVQPRMHGGYAGARGARLSSVMWFVHGLHDHGFPDYWWRALDETSLAAALAEALDEIERYGIPWLESPDAPKPWEMPINHADEFGQAVQAMMAREMEQLGYRLERQSLPTHQPYCYFSKAMAGGTFALIELQPIYSLEPGEFYFDVRLQRRGDNDPLAFDGDYLHGHSMSLAQLVWRAHSGVPLDCLTVSDVKSLFWRYRDRSELDAQLIAVLEQIKRIGCAWVEQPAKSKVIQ